MRVTVLKPREPVARLHLGDGMSLPERFEAHVSSIDNVPYAFKLGIAIESGRAVVDSMEVLRTRDGPPVTNEALRRLPIGEVTRAAVVAALSKYSSRTPIPLAGKGNARLSLLEGDARLEKVALIYRWATLLGHPPKETVAKDFEVSTATAGRLVRQARDAGFLGEAIGTKAGEA